MSKLQILTPVSTSSDFFPQKDYFFPKPLIDIKGQGMIYRYIDNITKDFENFNISFVINSHISREFSLAESLRLYLGNNNVNVIERLSQTNGALCSCLLAIDSLDKDLPLIISNYDQVINTDFKDVLKFFNDNNADAGVITFNSLHPRWSYVIMDDQENVNQAVEKKVISKNAIAGFYYYKKSSYFFDAAMNAVLNNATKNGIFYLSSSINELILSGKKILNYEIDASDYNSFYSPEAVKKFIDRLI